MGSILKSLYLFISRLTLLKEYFFYQLKALVLDRLFLRFSLLRFHAEAAPDAPVPTVRISVFSDHLNLFFGINLSKISGMVIIISASQAISPDTTPLQAFTSPLFQDKTFVSISNFSPGTISLLNLT